MKNKSDHDKENEKPSKIQFKTQVFRNVLIVFMLISHGLKQKFEFND